jgi:hypothetical protein
MCFIGEAGSKRSFGEAREVSPYNFGFDFPSSKAMTLGVVSRRTGDFKVRCQRSFPSLTREFLWRTQVRAEEKPSMDSLAF